MPPRPRNSHLLDQVIQGDHIEVWWPHDATYYSGVVGTRLPSGRHRILYDDGEVEDLRLATEQWRFTGAAAQRVLHSPPPPLDVPSFPPSPPPGPGPGPAPDSGSAPITVAPPPRPSTPEAPPAKPPPTKKRAKPNNPKIDTSRPVPVKIAPRPIPVKPKKPSFDSNGKPLPTLAPRPRPIQVRIAIPRRSLAPTAKNPAISKLPAVAQKPPSKSTKVKKRQRSSSTNSHLETTKTTKLANTSHPLPALDDDSGLIDAAPLGAVALNKPSTPQLPATSPKPATAPVPRVTTPPVNNGAKIDHPQRKAPSPVIPSQSLTKPVQLKPSSAPASTNDAGATVRCSPKAPASDTPSLNRRISTGSGNPHQKRVRKKKSSSGGVHATNQSKVTTSPCTARQQPEAAEKEKQTAEPRGTNITSKKGSTSIPSSDVERRRVPEPTESKRPETSPSSSAAPAQSGTPKPKPLNHSVEKAPTATNRGGAPKRVAQKTPVGLDAGSKSLHTTPDKSKNQNSEKQDAVANGAARAKLQNTSEQNGAKPNEPVKQRSVKNQPKGRPQSSQNRIAESSPTPKIIAGDARPTMAPKTSNAGNVEQRRPASDAKDISSSPRPGASRLHPSSGANSKGTGSPRKVKEQVSKKRSRLKADHKGPSKSNGGSVAKMPALKKSISKPVKSGLQRQSIGSLPPRPQTELNGRGRAVNPNDGSDIIANVNVPRKPRGGPPSPLLRSPLSEGRHSFPSPPKSGSKSDGSRPRPNGLEPKNCGLQQPLAAGHRGRGDRSPLVKGERPGGKIGPFQPTKRRSEVHKQVAASQEKQQSLPDSHSRNANSKTPHQSPTQDMRTSPLSKCPQSDGSHEAPAVSKMFPVHTNEVTGKPMPYLSIPGSRQAAPTVRQAPSSKKQMETDSDALKKSVSTSAEHTKNFVQPQLADENAHKPLDRSKPTGTTSENLVANSVSTKRIVVEKQGDLSQLERTTRRLESPHGGVNEKAGGHMRESMSPTPAVKTSTNAENEAMVNTGVKRPAQEHLNGGKRRKLDSSKKHNLKQATKVTAVLPVSGTKTRIPKTLPQRSSASHQHSIMKKADAPRQKERTKKVSQNKPATGAPAAPAASAAQAQQVPDDVRKGDKGESRREGAEKPESPKLGGVGHHERSGSALNRVGSCEGNDSDRRVEARVGKARVGKTQTENAGGLAKQSTGRPMTTESADPPVTATGAAISTAALESPQSGSTREGSNDKGAVIPQSTAPRPLSTKPCVKTVMQVPTTAIGNGRSKEEEGRHPRTKGQQVKKRPDPPPASIAPTNLPKLQPPGVKESKTGAHGSQPSSAPRRFARVRSRQSTGSIPDNANSKSLANATPQPNNELVSLPLNVLTHAVTEPSNKGREPQSTLLSRCFEKMLTEQKRFMRSMQGQMDKNTQTLESLRKELGEVRNAVSKMPSTEEIEALLGRLVHETKQLSAQIEKNHTSQVKNLGDQLERSISDAATQVQKDSMMGMFTVFDKAMNTTLPPDKPRDADGNQEENGYQQKSGRAEPVGAGVNETNRSREANCAEMDADHMPNQPNQFVRAGNTGKEKPVILPALSGLPVAGSQPKSGKPTGNGESHMNRTEPALSSDERPSGVVENENVPITRATNAPNQEKSLTPRKLARSAPQSAEERVQPQVETVNLIQVDDSGPLASSPNAVQAISEDSVGQEKNEHASNVDHRGKKDTKTIRQPRPARREDFESLTSQVRLLLARCAVEWFLKGGCRDVAPPDERTKSVSTEWVKKCVLSCLLGILERLEPEKTFDGAMREVADNLGREIQSDWLLRGPTVYYINEARKNYAEWDPQLYDFEWDSEKRVLACLSDELIRAEESLVESGDIFEDPLYTAIRYVEHAGNWNALSQ